MAELILNLKNKSYEELVEALRVMSSNEDKVSFIDIDGSAYMIPKKVLQLIDSLASENERLKDEGNGL
jgi:hypothetical protein|tara:strand:- start:810 stop:1013 length:204 start_codon:yes stop_codon:yes gene_type:complete